MSENSSRLRYIELPNDIIKCPLCDFQRSSKERKLVYNHTFKKHQIKITTKIVKSPEQIEDQLLKSRRLINERVKRHRLMKLMKLNHNDKSDHIQQQDVNNNHQRMATMNHSIDYDTNSVDENIEEVIEDLDINDLDLFNLDINNLSETHNDCSSTCNSCDTKDLIDNNNLLNSDNHISSTSNNNGNKNLSVEDQDLLCHNIKNENNIDKSYYLDNNNKTTESISFNNDIDTHQIYNKHCRSRSRSSTYGIEVNSVTSNTSIVIPPPKKKSKNIVTRFFRKISKNLLGSNNRNNNKSSANNNSTTINRSRDNSMNSIEILDSTTVIYHHEETISNNKHNILGNHVKVTRSRDNSVNSTGIELMQEEIIPTPTISPNTSMKMTTTTTNNATSNPDYINNSPDWNTTSTSNSYLTSLFDRFKTLE